LTERRSATRRVHLSANPFKKAAGRSSIAGGLVALLLLILVAEVLLSLCVGQYSMSLGESARILFSKLFGFTQDWPGIAERVVFSLRLPRVLAAALVGAALSVSGATYQGIFRNPLVSPDLLGVSAGACVGAAIGILAGTGAAGIQLGAFVFGIGTVALTLSIPRLLRTESNIMLVLSGIVVAGLMSSIMGFIKYIADPETELAPITYWQMGSFSYVDFSNLTGVLPALAIGFAVLFAISWWLDVLSLGDDEARLLGANVRVIRNTAVCAATLLTAGAICVSGTVSWIGLVIPHFARMFVGPNNTRLLPIAALLGAIFLIAVDTATRTMTVVELPISILTGVIGAPFYVYLLYKQRLRLK
jgi:iron complex transport system permease protein